MIIVLRQISLILFGIAILTNCAADPVVPDAFTQSSPEAPLVHRASNFSFPSEVACFRRENAGQGEASGKDVHVTYTTDERCGAVTLTVYVYPINSISLAAEFGAREDEIAKWHDGAQPLSSKAIQVTPRNVAALASSYAYEGMRGETSLLLQSELVIAQGGDNFIEYRFTYPASAEKLAYAEIRAFERQFKWPDSIRETAGSADVVTMTRFLEAEPLSKYAPTVRDKLLRWEEKTKDVAVLVCPGVLAPLPDKDVQFNAELCAQFIFGSASFQLLNPSQKASVFAGQLAGVRSIIATYRSILALKPEARIPRFDQLSQFEADGTLEEVLRPVVATECKTTAP